MVKENGMEFDEVEEADSKLYHGKVGAIVVKNKYGLNERIQKALIYHTITAPDMDDLAKIIYIADKIAEGREDESPDVEEERKLADNNLDDAMVFIIDRSIEHLIERGRIIHPNAVLTRNKILDDRQKTN